MPGALARVDRGCVTDTLLALLAAATGAKTARLLVDLGEDVGVQLLQRPLQLLAVRACCLPPQERASLPDNPRSMDSQHTAMSKYVCDQEQNSSWPSRQRAVTQHLLEDGSPAARGRRAVVGGCGAVEHHDDVLSQPLPQKSQPRAHLQQPCDAELNCTATQVLRNSESISDTLLVSEHFLAI